MIETIGPKQYLDLVRSGAARLASYRKEVNDLNVFPIPDGDTGDNMYMTIEAGCNASGETLQEMAQAVSRGMLMGARGNSGVILSRIFAGLAKGLEGVGEAGLPEIEKAMECAVSEAYGTVSNPVEGTILTVLREGAEAACGCRSTAEYSDRIAEAMAVSLEHTPEKLDVLRKAGVVDSGGAGLLYICEGMRDAIHGVAAEAVLPQEDGASRTAQVDLDAFTEDSVLEFGYCTEFLLRLQRSKVDLETFDESVLRDWLQANGESLVFFRDGSIIKVHVHTHDPGEILSKCREWGEFLTIKVENMTLQHHENHMDERFKRSHKPLGIVAVAAGKGLTDAFREMGADEVIEGGQTMNPPVERFLEAFDHTSADTILVFPNNSNILLTACQAAELYKKSDIRVIPTKTLGEGYYAMANMPAAVSVDEMVQGLTEAAASVTTGMVSQAIRDTDAGRKGDYLGFNGKKILCGSPERSKTAIRLAEVLDASSHDIVLILAGADVPAEEAEALRQQLEQACPLSECILLQGGQPIYDYILVLC